MMAETSTLVLFVVVGVLRAALLLAMAVGSYRLMRVLQVDRNRRRVNPAVWGSLLFLASSGVGMSLLTVRQVLLWATSGGSPWWWLLYDSPDLLGDLGYAACSVIAASGVLLMLRGVRALVYHGEAGEIPAVRWRWPFRISWRGRPAGHRRPRRYRMEQHRQEASAG